MARIEERVRIEASVSRVWSVLIDWEGQARWMADARDVAVLSEHREGEGVVIRCATDLLGLVVDDDMKVTRWVEGELIAIRHLGRIIRGTGAFELSALPDGATRFLWWEEVEAPLGRFGDAMARALIVPWVSRVFRRSLVALRAECDRAA